MDVIIQKYDSEITDEDLGKYHFLCDSDSKKIIFSCSVENMWMNVEDMEDEVLKITDKPEYNPSITEEKIKHIKRYIDMDLPDAALLRSLHSAELIEQSTVDDYFEKVEKQYLTPEDIEIEADRQNVSMKEIKKMVQEFAERIDKKEQGNTLLINGGEDIEK